MSVTIRDAERRDAAAISALMDVLGYPTPPEEVPARIERFVTLGNGRVLVAQLGEEVAGLASLEMTWPIHHDRPVAHLSALAVSATARRQGVGRALLDAVIALAGQAGCRRVVVASGEQRADAHAFYVAAGWEYSGRRFRKSLPA